MKPGRLRVVAASALLASSCQLASRSPERTGFDQVGVTEFSGSLRLEVEAREEKREASTGSLDLSELRTREELKLALAGFYYHPKLLEWNLETLSGLEQRDLERTGSLESTSINGQNLGYNLRLRLFKDNPYFGEFYTLRTETLMRQSFFETNETVTEETGVVAKARDWWIPTELKASTYSSVGRGTNRFSLKRDKVVADGRRVKDDSEYTFRTELNSVEQFGGAEPVDGVVLEAGTKFQLGEKRQHYWANTLSLRDQSGGLTTTRRLAQSNYKHSWTKNLETDHWISFEANSRDDQETDRLRVSSSILHQLFLSLRSRGELIWTTESFGEGSIDTYEASGELNYTKNVPFGRLGVTQSVNTQLRMRGNLQGTASVLEESYTYQPGVPIFLNSFAIDTLGIVVKDSTGLVVYTRNVDYFVVQVGSRTRIDIPVTSLISAGDVILVDYDFLPTPEQDIQTVRLYSRVSLAIGSVANLAIGRSSSQQTLTSGFNDGTLDDLTRTFASASYFPWQSTTFSANFEDLQSKIIPYQRLNASMEQRLPMFEGFDWRASANAYRVTYGDIDGIEKGHSASTFLSATLGRSLRGSLRGEYHNVEYLTDSGNGYMAELELSKNFHDTTLSLSARYLNEEFVTAEDRSLLYVTFHITRTF
jgi:hypothetical protein